MRSAEFSLLLDCLRVAVGVSSETPVEVIKGSNQNIDWVLFSRLANHHRVLALVYGVLKHEDCFLVPEPILIKMQERVHQQSKTTLWLASELVHVCWQLEEKGIQVLSLKGPLLALRIYGDLLLREQGDLDLFVSPETYSEVKHCLLELGYRCAHPNADNWSSIQERTFLDLYGQISFFRSNPDCIIDVHVRWFRNPYAFEIPFSTAWEQRDIVILQGYGLSVPDPLHSFLFLCVHGAKHRWEKLFWLCDIIKWLKTHPDEDWYRHLQMAKDLHCERPLGQVFVLVQRSMSVSTPEAIERYVHQDPSVLRLADQALAQLEHFSFPSVDETSSHHKRASLPSALWRELNYMTLLQRRFVYKLGCLSHLKTSTKDWDLFPLPPWLTPLYYPLRPLLYFLRVTRNLGRKSE